MPSKFLDTSQIARDRLLALGEQLRAHRKALRVSTVAAAEAAGMSRVTLHRIERGEPSVTMGAYLNAIMALGMDLSISSQTASSANDNDQSRQPWIPARVELDQYPQLKLLAWQVQGSNVLTPAEALRIYERNWRHVDAATLTPPERNLIDALQIAFGEHAQTKEASHDI